MTFPVRTATGDTELRAADHLFEVAFGRLTSDVVRSFVRTLLEPDSVIAADDAGRPVGTALDFPMSMTIPGGGGHRTREVGVRAVTGIAVAPTHRRRGILRSMMTTLLTRADPAATPLAALTATEGGIYGRFGFGVATVGEQLSVDRRFATFHRGLPDPGGVVTLPFDSEDARTALPEIYTRWQRSTPGAQPRPRSLWELEFTDPEEFRRGRSEKFLFLHDDGYALFRRSSDRTTAHVVEFVAVTETARLALWHALCGLDLVETIEMVSAPGDPAPLYFEDQRLTKTTGRYDEGWLRILDVPRALEARAYGCDARVVIEVNDEFLDAGGTFALTVSDGEATCVPTTATADLRLPIDTLGALYLGGRSAVQFARAGRLDARTQQMLHQFDATMRGDVMPQLGWHF